MATYKVQAPDGHIIKLEGPDGASEAEVMAQAQKLYQPKAAPKPSKWADRAMSFAQGAVVDTAKGLADTGLRATGLVPAGVSPINALANVSSKVIGAATDAMSGRRGTTAEVQNALVAGYQPKTEGGKLARTAGQLSTAALLPGSAPQRVLNVLAPLAGGELAGRGVKALGGNERQQEAARAIGQAAGGFAANVRVSGGRPKSADPVADAVGRGQDPEVMAQRAAEFRKAGVEPTLTDLVDDSGRGTVRAAASRMTPGRQAATDYRDAAVADTKPAVMAKAQKLSPEARTADQLVEHLFTERDTQATGQYRKPYQEQVPLNEDILAALSDAPGKAALQRARSAAVARMDPERVAELDSLLNHDGPLAMDQASRMARADEQGFTQDAYHGTPQAFPGDVRPGNGSNTGPHAKGAIYAADDPGVANSYARGDAPAVYPLRIRPDGFDQMGADEFSSLMGAPPAQGQGAPGLTVPNMRDYSPLPIAGPTPPATTIGVFDPSRARSAFDPFAPEGYKPPPESVSAATLDRARIAMSERGKTASMRGANDLAGGYSKRAGMIDETLDKVPGLQDARANYRAKSQAIDVLGKGSKDVFATDPGDYADWVKTLTPEAKKANAVRIRQDILDELGGKKRAGSMGSLDALTSSKYARENLSEALGPQTAEAFLGFVSKRLQQVRNANDIAPRTGSQTQNKAQDAAELAGIGIKGLRAVHGDVRAMAGLGMDWLKSRGMNDAIAEKIVRQATSTDPAVVNKAIAQIRARYGTDGVEKFRMTLNSSTAKALSGQGPDWPQSPPSMRPSSRQARP